jgi:hypothetical protein
MPHLKKETQHMRNLSKQLRLSLLIGLLLTGCVVSNPKFFSTIDSTNDLSYGYTANNPIAIKNADLKNSIGSSYYYLSRLRTEKGNKLRQIQRYTVKNSNYKKPAIGLYNRFTGDPMSYGSGPFLDLYILRPENEMDTIKIYINPYLKGIVKIPIGLKFEKE